MEERIGIYIKRINDLIEKHINASLKKYNLTLSQGRILKYLENNKNKEVTQKELENFFNISHATISGIINRLENNEYIKVDRSKKNNKIILLERIEKYTEIFKENQDELEKLTCKGFSEEEKERLLNDLKRYYSNLKEEN